MFELENFTFFNAQQFQNIDPLDRIYNVVVAKVSYEFEINASTGQTELKFAPEQTPLIYEDIYYGDTIRTSVKAECDFIIYKPKVDLVVNATAYAPNDELTRQFPVSVQIGDYKKSLAITGKRYWIKETVGWTLSDPEPITNLPIRYEYAFGGIHAGGLKQNGYLQENIVGVGSYSADFLRQHSTKKLLDAHQIYDPAKPVTDPSEIVIPEGLGFYARYFAHRVRHTGTTDKEWAENRAPRLPTDFSMSFWNGAHPTLQVPHLKHNHVYDLVFTGLVPAHKAPHQRFSVSLPVETVFIHILTPDRLSISKDMILDTIIVDVENRKIDCSYRIALAQELEIAHCQLRYIARGDRGTQIEAAQKRKASTEPDFIVIPPSLKNARLS
ncbi:MAG: DUF2169 domain-containing protein [Neisseria sp.]|uniref:DUF2169 family type VI secretion system accessory protein n=1 Tax=Neisseria sp. TaxID=192066 RepID=UPI0026DA858A|nr:DUF2169 domain-containing protein [Neisseria sp.]MDO4641977.1 DUF2169 domain-containing protein [Neisseria sp.]